MQAVKHGFSTYLPTCILWCFSLWQVHIVQFPCTFAMYSSYSIQNISVRWQILIHFWVWVWITNATTAKAIAWIVGCAVYWWATCLWMLIYTLRPRQNGRHFAVDHFKCIFWSVNTWISIITSLKFLLKGPTENNPALVYIVAWRRPGVKPLSEPMMVNSLTRICITQPQWVNCKTTSVAIWLFGSYFDGFPVYGNKSAEMLCCIWTNSLVVSKMIHLNVHLMCPSWVCNTSSLPNNKGGFVESLLNLQTGE